MCFSGQIIIIVFAHFLCETMFKQDGYYLKARESSSKTEAMTSKGLLWTLKSLLSKFDATAKVCKLLHNGESLKISWFWHKILISFPSAILYVVMKEDTQLSKWHQVPVSSSQQGRKDHNSLWSWDVSCFGHEQWEKERGSATGRRSCKTLGNLPCTHWRAGMTAFWLMKCQICHV